MEMQVMMAVNSHNGIEQSDLMPTESRGMSIQTATTISLTLRRHCTQWWMTGVHRGPQTQLPHRLSTFYQFLYSCCAECLVHLFRGLA